MSALVIMRGRELLHDHQQGAQRRVVRVSNALARASPPNGSRLITRIVSSPATVPRIESHPAWSMADARNWAAPGGVRRITRLADASADTRSSSAILLSLASGFSA